MTEFRKSSYCGSSACVEVDRSSVEDLVQVADSKDPERAPLEFTRDEWRAFVRGVRDGQFDV